MSQNNSIEFQSAMENFQKMFPMMDSDVIEEILRINRGSVEKTIDQLLTISGDNQNISQTREINKPNPSVNSDLSRSTKSTRNWNPVLLKDLDQNFLRIRTTHDLEYCDEFAVMLQNEEFLAELRFNQEFLTTLSEEQGKEDKPLEEKLKNMGKVSRKKCQQLAKIFTFQRKKNSSSKTPKQSSAIQSKLLDECSDDEAKK